MKLLTVITALVAARALASPVLEDRNPPDAALPHQHAHLENHLGHKMRARHGLNARALAAGAPNGEDSHEQNSPISNEPMGSNENASPVAPVKAADQDSPVHPADSSSALSPAASNPPTTPVNNNSPLTFDDDNDGDTPAEDVIELLDELYGHSKGEGPSDDWRDQWEGQPQPGNPSMAPPAPISQPPKLSPSPPSSASSCPATARPKKTIIIYETEIVWVTAYVQPQKVNEAPATPPAPPPPPPPPPPSSAAPPPPPPQPAAADTKPASPPYVAPANTKPTPPSNPNANAIGQSSPPAQSPPQKPAQQAQPKTPNTAEPQPSAQAQPQSGGKPQPSQKQPAGGPSDSHVNTDGLPMEYVDGLDCHSDVFKGLAKLHHDIHRTNHSLSPLAWNDTLFEYAKETAETCVYGHSLVAGGGGYGQNIASGDAPGNISAVLTNAYYNAEIGLFFEAIGREWGCDSPDMSNFEKWGHATQMLWKSTTSFACYTATCSPPGQDPLKCKADGSSYLKNVGCGNGGTKAYNTVCNYYPPGNYAGEYSAVPGPEGHMGFVQMTMDGVIGLH